MAYIASSSIQEVNIVLAHDTHDLVNPSTFFRYPGVSPPDKGYRSFRHLARYEALVWTVRIYRMYTV